LREIANGPRPGIAQVKQGIDSLPNADGQVWREYDISPYTLRVTATNTPEQAIIDWILRETGYEAWHSSIVTVLGADERTLRVYHTPQMHAAVADVVDRFVNTQTESHAFGMRVVTIDNVNWRSRARRLLQPVPAQSPGVQAWLLQKEDAALLLAELRRRTDFREHSSPHLLVSHGQSTSISTTRARSYVRDISLRPDAWPGFEGDTTQIDEGFTLELSPLISLDGQSIDAVLKLNVDQVEKLLPVTVEVPTTIAPRQRTKVEVPQMSQFRLQERFRWPADRVLLVGVGVVPTPVPGEPNPLLLGLPLGNSPPRADLLVFIESKGKTGQAPTVTRVGANDSSKTYRGRY